MQARQLRRLLPGGRRKLAGEDGAVALEFALCMPLLILFLFGIIQYGYGLFQLQEFNSALGDASQLAATGITDCTSFEDSLTSLVENNGLGDGSLGAIHVAFLTADNQPTDAAQRYGLVKVTASYKPFKLGFPGIPFPDSITRSQTVQIQDIGLASLTKC